MEATRKAKTVFFDYNGVVQREKVVPLIRYNNLN